MEAMPGPKFKENTEGKSWFSRNSQKIVLSLIVILLAVGAYYFYKNYQQRQELLKPAIEGTEELSPSPTASPAEIAISSPSPTPTPQPTVQGAQQAQPAAPTVISAPAAREEDSNVVVTAVKGNGVTHLARQALKEYLKDKSDLAGQLRAEQKIYIEDYLQKHVTHPPVLKVGSEISFSDSLINDAINQSQKLTDKQINNLHKYVLLVPSLQTP